MSISLSALSSEHFNYGKILRIGGNIKIRLHGCLLVVTMGDFLFTFTFSETTKMVTLMGY